MLETLGTERDWYQKFRRIFAFRLPSGCELAKNFWYFPWAPVCRTGVQPTSQLEEWWIYGQIGFLLQVVFQSLIFMDLHQEIQGRWALEDSFRIIGVRLFKFLFLKRVKSGLAMGVEILVLLQDLKVESQI